MLHTLLFICLGLSVLIIGAECLTRGATALALKLNIAPLVIGLTVVAFGTSAPELTVNIIAALQGTPTLAIGNVIGSNITNILLILGVTAIIMPLQFQRSTVWKEIPFALGSVVAMLLFGNNHWLQQPEAIIAPEGILFIAAFIVFIVYVIRLARTTTVQQVQVTQSYNWAISLSLLGVGLVGLFVGGKLLVDSAVQFARLLGVSDTLIGLTVVAIGTSLPELVTSVVAAVHKHDGIAIGNIIGSNIFNVLWVIGVTSIMTPLPFTAAVNFDVIILLAVTSILFGCILLNRHYELHRWHGVAFVLLYIGYLVYIVQRG